MEHLRIFYPVFVLSFIPYDSLGCSRKTIITTSFFPSFQQESSVLVEWFWSSRYSPFIRPRRWWQCNETQCNATMQRNDATQRCYPTNRIESIGSDPSETKQIPWMGRYEYKQSTTTSTSTSNSNLVWRQTSVSEDSKPKTEWWAAPNDTLEMSLCWDNNSYGLSLWIHSLNNQPNKKSTVVLRVGREGDKRIEGIPNDGAGGSDGNRRAEESFGDWLMRGFGGIRFDSIRIRFENSLL